MNDLMQHELKGAWLGMPKAYQPLDAMGVAMGAWFLYDGVAYPRRTAWVNIALGAVMIYIHSQRFFYAPQDRAGLNRLLSALEVTPEELCR